jgi:protein-L-isoaspartate(D-aspartate) O-methyltransferase
MVDQQLIPRGISDSRVLSAMRAVPRHKFVSESRQHLAYADGPLPIGCDQTISQPYIVALMAAAARLAPESSVLEIGTGCGYSAAVLAECAGTVFTIERIASLSEAAQALLTSLGYSNACASIGDGTLGWPEHAPYDAIIVTAAAPAVPPSLEAQLVDGGRLIVPVGTTDSQTLLRVTKRSGKATTTEVIESVRFVPLLGKEGW